MEYFINLFKVVNAGQEPIVRPGRPIRSPVTMVITAMTMECTPLQDHVNRDISAMDRLFLHVRVYSVNIGILTVCRKLIEPILVSERNLFKYLLGHFLLFS